MSKRLLILAILFGTLGIFAALQRPNVNDPEFWKGAPNAVYRTQTRPGPPSTPAPVMLGRNEVQVASSAKQSNDEKLLADTAGQYAVQ
jgi:hypothetical protein